MGFGEVSATLQGRTHKWHPALSRSFPAPPRITLSASAGCPQPRNQEGEANAHPEDAESVDSIPTHGCCPSRAVER